MVDNVPELDELEDVWNVCDAPREMPEKELPPTIRRIALSIAFAITAIILGSIIFAVMEFVHLQVH